MSAAIRQPYPSLQRTLFFRHGRRTATPSGSMLKAASETLGPICLSFVRAQGVFIISSQEPTSGRVDRARSRGVSTRLPPPAGNEKGPTGPSQQAQSASLGAFLPALFAPFRFCPSPGRAELFQGAHHFSRYCDGVGPRDF